MSAWAIIPFAAVLLVIIAAWFATEYGTFDPPGGKHHAPPEPKPEPGRKRRQPPALTAGPAPDTIAELASMLRLRGRGPAPPQPPAPLPLPGGIPPLHEMTRADGATVLFAGSEMPGSAGQRAGYWTPRDGPVPCLCTRQNTEAAATTAVMDCPMHGNPGYGPGAFLPWQPPAAGEPPARAGIVVVYDDGQEPRVHPFTPRGDPQPYCSRPGCANRAGHWTEAHPEPDPAVKALLAERERATRLPDYVLAPDALNGHLTVDSLIDSIVMRKIGPVKAEVNADA